jgi:hypothetical protein
VVDGDTTTSFVELAEVEDACSQARDGVHPCKRAVLATLAGEEDAAPPLDLGDRVIAKLDLAAYLSVELSEEIIGAGHVVGGAGVEYPTPITMLHQWVEVGECNTLCYNPPNYLLLSLEA